MRALIFIFTLTGCTNAPPTSKTVSRRYHVLNGYSSFQPTCAEIEYMSWGIKAVDCVNGTWRGDVINPTVIEDSAQEDNNERK